MIIKHHGNLKKDIKKMLLNTPNLRGLKNNSTILITEIMFHTRIISSIIPKCVYHQKKGDIGKIITSPNFLDVKNPNIQITKNMYFSIKNKIMIILILVLLSILILNLKKVPLKKNLITIFSRNIKTTQTMYPIGKTALEKRSPYWEAISSLIKKKYKIDIQKQQDETLFKTNPITICKVGKTQFEESLTLAHNSLLNHPFTGGEEHFMFIIQLLCKNCPNDKFCVEICIDKKTIITHYATHNSFFKCIDNMYLYLKNNKDNPLFERESMIHISITDLTGKQLNQYAFPVTINNGDIFISQDAVKDLKVMPQLTSNITPYMLERLAKERTNRMAKNYDFEEHELRQQQRVTKFMQISETFSKNKDITPKDDGF